MQKIIDCPLFNFFSSNGVFRILNFCTISRITSVSKISFKYDVMHLNIHMHRTFHLFFCTAYMLHTNLSISRISTFFIFSKFRIYNVPIYTHMYFLIILHIFFKILFNPKSVSCSGKVANASYDVPS